MTSERRAKNATTVTRIVALDPPGEPESHNLTTVTRIVILDPSGEQKCYDSYEARDIGSIRKHVLTTLTGDCGIKAEGNKVTTVTRILTLDPSGAIISRQLRGSWHSYIYIYIYSSYIALSAHI